MNKFISTYCRPMRNCSLQGALYGKYTRAPSFENFWELSGIYIYIYIYEHVYIYTHILYEVCIHTLPHARAHTHTRTHPCISVRLLKLTIFYIHIFRSMTPSTTSPPFTCSGTASQSSPGRFFTKKWMDSPSIRGLFLGMCVCVCVCVCACTAPWELEP